MKRAATWLAVCVAGMTALTAASPAAPPAKAAPAKKAPARKKPPKKKKVYKAYASVKDAGKELAFLGDYQGKLKLAIGKEQDVFAQVINLGKGKHKALLLPTLAKRADALAVLQGTAEGGKLTLTGPGAGTLAGLTVTATVADGKMAGTLAGTLQKAAGAGKFKITIRGTSAGAIVLSRFQRLSPTLGATPPKSAVVLFDGTSTDAWAVADRKKPDDRSRPCTWQILTAKDGPDCAGAMQVRGPSIVTKKNFASFTLHVEFRSPLMPEAPGQARGNSGVYVHNRYEIQVLDSYALSGEWNECGGIYKVGKPSVNMCAPPLQWQTYDIDFTAPAGGAKPRITVRHNGVVIHDDIELPKPTGGSLHKQIGPTGGIYLQNHGNPVQFRNIYLVPKK